MVNQTEVTLRHGSPLQTFCSTVTHLEWFVQSAVLNAMSGGSGLLIKSTTDYLNNYSAGQGSSGEWGARTAGTHVNSLGVSMCTNATAYEQNLGSSNQTVGEDRLVQQ